MLQSFVHFDLMSETGYFYHQAVVDFYDFTNKANIIANLQDVNNI